MPEPVSIPVTRLPHGTDLQLPAYKTEGAVGMDLLAAVPEDAPIRLRPMGRAPVPTGIAIALPAGYEAQVRPRSGLAAKHGITLLNAPGTVDWDYRGEIKAVLINLGEDDFLIRRGERIAQLVIAPATRGAWQEVPSLDETVRGDGGFGSTGVRG